MKNNLINRRRVAEEAIRTMSEEEVRSIMVGLLMGDLQESDDLFQEEWSVMFGEESNE